VAQQRLGSTLVNPCSIAWAHTLDEAGVYEWSKVEEFCTRYFNGEDAQTLSPLIEAAAERFNAVLDIEVQTQDLDVQCRSVMVH
jgi:hypothetical protein